MILKVGGERVVRGEYCRVLGDRAVGSVLGRDIFPSDHYGLLTTLCVDVMRDVLN